MNKELEDKLFEKYPKIFRQKDLSMQETCMCWGLEVGNGWYSIIDNLCAKIQNYINSTGREQVEAVQVKEKFGDLRFYTDFSDKAIDTFIEEAEEEAGRTCEFCGTTENTGHTKGWIVTCCEKCAKEIGKDWKKNVTNTTT